MTKQALETEIARWDRRYNGKNPHAGAIALLRLDDAWAEYESGKSLETVLRENFNDRLLTMLLKAAGILTNAPA